MIEYFPGDRYDSPADTPRALREYFLLGSRWSPYTFFFEIILTYRALALKGLYDDEAWTRSSFELMRYLERCKAVFHISGMDKVRAVQGPVVFVANHMSTLETTALPGIICPIKRVTYVVKSKLLNGFFWGPIMRSREPIPVARKDPKADLERVLTEGQAKLAAGISVIVFPQGTRTEVFSRSGFNSLGVKLAARAGVPVLPIAVKTDYWGSGAIMRGFGTVRRDRPIYIEFGDPIDIAGKPKGAHEKCLGFIEGRLREWGARIEDEPAGAAAR